MVKPAVSNYGRFMSKRGVIRTPNPMRSGYSFITVEGKNYLLHRVIAITFELPRLDGANIVDHIVPISQGGNNHLSNLRWVTSKENANYARNTTKFRMKPTNDVVDSFEGEEWRESVGGWKVSSFGRYRNLKGATKTPVASRNGYVKVGIQGKTYMLHRLIAVAFELSKPSDLHNEVDHIDGIASNNRVENLRWVTREQNIKHSYASNFKRASAGRQTSKAVEIFNGSEWVEYRSCTEAGESLGVPPYYVSSAALNQTKLKNDFVCRYVVAPSIDGEVWKEIDIHQITPKPLVGATPK